METSYQHFRRFYSWLTGSVTGLVFPAIAMAQSPVGRGHQIQPVLTLALVLTSLVLFFFYLFQKNRAHGQKNIDDKIKPKKDCGEKTLSRSHETDKALLGLFKHHDTPMAKFTLGKGEVIEVNSSFCLALGYSKHEISNKDGVELGLLPELEDDRQALKDKGWEEKPTSIFNRATNEWIPCHVLNTVILTGEIPMILCIVRDMPPASKTDPEYLPSQLDNIISTRISGESP